jgi:hypothetical protein
VKLIVDVEVSCLPEVVKKKSMLLDRGIVTDHKVVTDSAHRRVDDALPYDVRRSNVPLFHAPKVFCERLPVAIGWAREIGVVNLEYPQLSDVSGGSVPAILKQDFKTERLPWIVRVIFQDFKIRNPEPCAVVKLGSRDAGRQRGLGILRVPLHGDLGILCASFKLIRSTGTFLSYKISTLWKSFQQPERF